jgi:hypothetical protein
MKCKASKLIMLIILCSAFAITGCGRNNYETDEMDNFDEIQQHEESENTLRILAPTAYRLMIEHAEQNMRRSVPDFRIELTTYADNVDIMQHIQRMSIMMMAGQSYDIFFIEPQHPFLAYTQSGFLADIWQLIDACDRFERDDFYVQALEALTIGGGLYSFPLSVGFNFVGINANLPSSIIDMFTALDTITTDQMLGIYLALIDNYPDYRNMLQISSCIYTMSPETLTLQKIMEFTDFANRRTYLNDGRFAQFLDDLQRANSADVSSSLRNPLWMHLVNHEVLEHLSSHDVFIVKNRAYTPITAILDLELEEEQHFIGYIPLVDNMNRPITSMQPGMNSELRRTFGFNEWRTLSIAISDNQQLAWNFVSRYLVQAQLNRSVLQMHRVHGRGPSGPIPAGVRTLDLPILRNLSHTSINNTVSSIPTRPYDGYGAVISNNMPDGQILGSNLVMPSAGSPRDEAVNIVVAHLEQLAEQPLAPMLLIPADIMGDHLELMLLGVSSPIETANRLHNIITLWLIE